MQTRAQLVSERSKQESTCSSRYCGEVQEVEGGRCYRMQNVHTKKGRGLGHLRLFLRRKSWEMKRGAQIPSRFLHAITNRDTNAKPGREVFRSRLCSITIAIQFIVNIFLRVSFDVLQFFIPRWRTILDFGLLDMFKQKRASQLCSPAQYDQ